jgi:hypothetical protein
MLRQWFGASRSVYNQTIDTLNKLRPCKSITPQLGPKGAKGG